MAVTSKASGTQAATLDTEHTLSTVTDAGTYVLHVDANAMVNGDITLLRLKVKVGSGGTTRLAYSATLAHAQASLVSVSVPVASPHECVFTLEQTDGTGRSYPWEVVQVG